MRKQSFEYNGIITYEDGDVKGEFVLLILKKTCTMSY